MNSTLLTNRWTISLEGKEVLVLPHLLGVMPQIVALEGIVPKRNKRYLVITADKQNITIKNRAKSKVETAHVYAEAWVHPEPKVRWGEPVERIEMPPFILK